MPPFQQLFFIEGRLVGDTLRGAGRSYPSYYAPDSLLYYCALCGEVYAKFPVLAPQSRWHHVAGVCRKCGAKVSDSPHVAGSIWRGWDTDFTEALPAPVLQWEFERCLEYYERNEES